MAVSKGLGVHSSWIGPFQLQAPLQTLWMGNTVKLLDLVEVSNSILAGTNFRMSDKLFLLQSTWKRVVPTPPPQLSNSHTQTERKDLLPFVIFQCTNDNTLQLLSSPPAMSIHVYFLMQASREPGSWQAVSLCSYKFQSGAVEWLKVTLVNIIMKMSGQCRRAQQFTLQFLLRFLSSLWMWRAGMWAPGSSGAGL